MHGYIGRIYGHVVNRGHNLAMHADTAYTHVDRDGIEPDGLLSQIRVSHNDGEVYKLTLRSLSSDR